MDYLDHFARFKRKENVEAVERLLSAHQELAKFERAQLGTYLPFHQRRSTQAHPNQAHSAVNWPRRPKP
jgi:RNA polymerase Rpb4